MFRHFPLVFKNAARNRRRSVLTICSVGASLCLLGVMMAIYHAFFFTAPTPEEARRLVTRNRISLANIMPISYRQKIEQVPGVQHVTILQWFGGVYKEPKNFFGRMATEPAKFAQVYPEYKLVQGSIEEWERERTGCIVGTELARRFGFKLGDRITIVGDIFPVTMEFIVKGIYEHRQDNENLFFQLKYLFESMPRQRSDFAGMFVILADSAENTTRVAREVDDLFRNSPTQTRTETEKAFQLGFLSMLGNIKMFLLSICGALTFTILLVTANTMAMSVRERIREIGVLKTLGYTNQAVLGIVLGEAAFLSFLGGLVGYLFAHGLTFVVRQAPGFIVELKALTIVPPVAALLLLTAVVVGVGSALIPAYTASRTSILDALRYTG